MKLIWKMLSDGVGLNPHIACVATSLGSHRRLAKVIARSLLAGIRSLLAKN